MSCNTRYWCSIAMAQKDKPSNPALAKENNDGLKAIMAARQAQDRAFDYRAQTTQGVSNQNHQRTPK
jgi:hypothetical protein